jgi:hypothetical protein
LGEAGSTRIDPKEDKQLLNYWENSDLWPTTMEYATSISGSPGEPHIFSNFCPEVAFDRFDYFASLLSDTHQTIEKKNYNVPWYK